MKIWTSIERLILYVIIIMFYYGSTRSSILKKLKVLDLGEFMFIHLCLGDSWDMVEIMQWKFINIAI